eukprot:CAMPEP_0116118216 /NCGR_PEP_ID=MMETSP0329-20121206/1986_1 /TAXON_ID=697910 /ORGANISM="Pseudo-nitzschia arenysensis, Strain B593" /LENGTH=131 /DNA_ID=CAMNT_0003611829 /DNA_START=90 /DNA_END=485 /DNA_ORIENTATION=+
MECPSTVSPLRVLMREWAVVASNPEVGSLCRRSNQTIANVPQSQLFHGFLDKNLYVSIGNARGRLEPRGKIYRFFHREIAQEQIVLPDNSHLLLRHTGGFGLLLPIVSNSDGSTRNVVFGFLDQSRHHGNE